MPSRRTVPPHSGTSTSSHCRSSAALICSLLSRAMLWFSSGQGGLAGDLEGQGRGRLVVVGHLRLEAREERLERPGGRVHVVVREDDLVVAGGLVLEVADQHVVQGGLVVDVRGHLARVLQAAEELHPRI